MESSVAEYHHLFVEPFDEWVERGVVDVCGVAVPYGDQAEFVQDQAELSSDDPSVVGLSLLAYLSGSPPFPYGMYQFNTVRIDDTEECGRGQEAVGPVLMGPKAAKESSALRQGGEHIRDGWHEATGRRVWLRPP